MFFFSCQEKKNNSAHKKLTSQKEFVIITPYGDLQFKLYNETPLHRDNFCRLIKDGVYKNSLLHFVIDGFVLQGGMINNENKYLEKIYNYPNINSEISQKFIHKKGVISACRFPNNKNPEKNSNPLQFYIVLGEKQSDLMLNIIENRINKELFYERFSSKYALLDDSSKEYQQKYAEEFKNYQNEFYYTNEQKNIYKKIGGTPKLDMNYSIFGELINGFNVLDSLEKVKTNNYKPTEDIIIDIIILE